MLVTCIFAAYDEACTPKSSLTALAPVSMVASLAIMTIWMRHGSAFAIYPTPNQRLEMCFVVSRTPPSNYIHPADAGIYRFSIHMNMTVIHPYIASSRMPVSKCK
jgi:hypothetical protein